MVNRSLIAEFLADSFSPQSIDRISIARRDVQSYSRAAALLELIMLKRGVLYTPLDIFFVLVTAR